MPSNTENTSTYEETLTSFAVFVEQYGPPIIISIIFLLLAVKAINYVLKYLSNEFAKKKIDAKLTQDILIFVKSILYLVIVFVIASILGISTSIILFFIIIIVILLIILMRSPLANIGSGIIIRLLKPFEQGDFIEINGTQGYFERINAYHTTLRLRNNSIAHFPNSEALNSDLLNMEENKIRRVDIDIYVAYTNDYDSIRKPVLKLAKKDERILANPKPNMIVHSAYPFGVRLRTRLRVNKKDYWNVLYEYNEIVLEVCNKLDVEYCKRDEYWFPEQKLGKIKPNRKSKQNSYLDN